MYFVIHICLKEAKKKESFLPLRKKEGTAILGENQALFAREHLNIFISLILSTLNIYASKRYTCIPTNNFTGPNNSLGCLCYEQRILVSNKVNISKLKFVYVIIDWW